MSNVVFISKVKSSDPLLDLPEKPPSQYASLEDYAYQHCLDYNELTQFIPITPPQRLPLTDEEIRDMWVAETKPVRYTSEMVVAFARAIERAHGIKGDDA